MMDYLAINKGYAPLLHRQNVELLDHLLPFSFDSHAECKIQ